MAGRYGRYEVLYKLGQGSMAQVFLARDPVLNRYVAVKVLHAGLAARKDVLQRFFNEARTVALIRNPHVVELFDFGREGTDLYQVMEFMDGLSLHGLLRRRSGSGTAGTSRVPARPGSEAESGRPAYATQEPALAAALMCQAAEGLAIAAAHGVVHRDLKPENLMLNGQGYLKISDFGIAHVQDEKLTRTGAVLGSPLYMSPEQARGLKPITAQSDMFSLGAVFYACLAGVPPFRGRTVTELFRAIAEAPHPPLAEIRPGLDRPLCALVDRLLSKRPEERGGGAAWLQRELKSFLAGRGITEPVELVADRLRGLRDQGMQSTWKEPTREATLPRTLVASQPVSTTGTSGREGTGRSGHEPGDPRPARRHRRALAATLAFLCGAAGAVGWALWMGSEPGNSAPPRVLSGVSTPKSGSNGMEPAAGRGKAVGTDSRARETDRTEGVGPMVRDSGFSTERRDRGTESGTESRPNPGIGNRESLGGMAGSGSEALAVNGANARGPDDAAEARKSARDRNSAPSAKGGGVLILKSAPPLAETFLDGRFVGVTPVRLESFAPGKHRLGMRSGGVLGLDTVLEFAPGTRILKVHLDRFDARIAVTSSPEE